MVHGGKIIICALPRRSRWPLSQPHLFLSLQTNTVGAQSGLLLSCSSCITSKNLLSTSEHSTHHTVKKAGETATVSCTPVIYESGENKNKKTLADKKPQRCSYRRPGIVLNSWHHEYEHACMLISAIDYTCSCGWMREKARHRFSFLKENNQSKYEKRFSLDNIFIRTKLIFSIMNLRGHIIQQILLQKIIAQ